MGTTNVHDAPCAEAHFIATDPHAAPEPMMLLPSTDREKPADGTASVGPSEGLSASLVWARLRGFPWWPARVRRLQRDGRSKVRFFATYDTAVLVPADVRPFSSSDSCDMKLRKRHLISKFRLAVAQARAAADGETNAADTLSEDSGSEGSADEENEEENEDDDADEDEDADEDADEDEDEDEDDDDVVDAAESQRLAEGCVVGDRIEARDSRGQWYASKVVDVRVEGSIRELKVHFLGWKARWDEWISADTARLRPCRPPAWEPKDESERAMEGRGAPTDKAAAMEVAQVSAADEVYESTQGVAIGTVVWAKLTGFPNWPAVVCSCADRGPPPSSSCVGVRFFDSAARDEFAWAARDSVTPFGLLTAATAPAAGCIHPTAPRSSRAALPSWVFSLQLWRPLNLCHALTLLRPLQGSGWIFAVSRLRRSRCGHATAKQSLRHSRRSRR